MREKIERCKGWLSAISPACTAIALLIWALVDYRRGRGPAIWVGYVLGLHLIAAIVVFVWPSSRESHKQLDTL